MRLHILKHVRYEGPGCIIEWAGKRGHQLAFTNVHEAEPLPGLNDYDWLIVMGGPMGSYDELTYPWLRREKSCIAQAIGAGKLVLGICLGAQLVAEVLGGQVGKHDCQEIGWFPVTLTANATEHPLFQGFPAHFITMHWHGDTFTLPKGALQMARSAACEQQAFLYNQRVLGLQFHLEVNQASVDSFLKQQVKPLTPGPYVQNQNELQQPEMSHKANQLMHQLLDNFVRLNS